MGEAELLRAIRAAPGDDIPRLIYADWLDERGEPRGNFIRAQVALDRLPADDPRRLELENLAEHWLGLHQQAWDLGLRGFVENFRFHRGFIDEVTLSAGQFLEGASWLAGLGVLQTVHLTEIENEWSAVIARPEFGTIRHLDLCVNHLGDSGIRLLVNSAAQQQLESLDLSFNNISDAGLEFLLSIRWPGLRSLDLAGSDGLTDRGIAQLAATRSLPALETLGLANNGLDAASVRHLARSSALGRVREIRWEGNPVGDDGAKALTGSPLLGRQVAGSGKLDLSRTELGPAGVQSLIGDPRFRRLRRLLLSGNRLDDAAVTALAVTEFPQLTELDLSSNAITDEGAIALAASPILQRLTRLSLERNQLGQAGIGAIGMSEYRNWRTVLELSFNRVPSPDPDAPLPLAPGD